MNVFDTPTISLETFEGPLDLLLHLVQKAEMDIYDVTLTEITHQFWKLLDELDPVDHGSEFLSLTSSLLLLKSKRLLPVDPTEDITEDPAVTRYDILEHLIEYCRFKELAKELSEREFGQQRHFPRGLSPLQAIPKISKRSGLEQLTLMDLMELLNVSLDKAASQHGVIKDEEWKLPDKIRELSLALTQNNRIAAHLLFTPTKSKQELIITLLAILELMKQGRCQLKKQESLLYLESAVESKQETVHDPRN